jgi:AraC-like DNA-binding protein
MKKKPHTEEIEKLIQVRDLIIWHCDKRFTDEELANIIDMDVEELKTRFKDWSTRSLQRYQTYNAISMGRILLSGSDRTIRNIAAEVGYTRVRSFSRQFNRFYGLSPRAYRKKLLQSQSPEKTSFRAKPKKRRYAR